jgi:hypothetical protein
MEDRSVQGTPNDASVFESVESFTDFERVVIQMQNESCSISSLQHLREFLEEENENEMSDFLVRVLPIIVRFARDIGSQSFEILTSNSNGSLQFSYSKVASVLSNFF